jgi:hypothetical protein
LTFKESLVVYNNHLNFAVWAVLWVDVVFHSYIVQIKLLRST